MSDLETELREQLAEARSLSNGPAKIATIERVVVAADSAGLVELALRARLDLIPAYHEGLQVAKVFAVFGWCLALWDREPERVDDWSAEMLRWHFKMVSSASRFPSVSLDQINGMLDRMERRYRLGGHSLHAVHSRRQQVAARIGDLATAESEYRLWMAAPRDENSDCAGCDPEGQVQWLTVKGQYAEAIALAEPVLSGRVGCISQPQDMLAAVLLPLTRLGRHDEAFQAHLRAYRQHRKDPDDIVYLSTHLEFLALAGHEVRGLEVLQRHLGWVDNPREPYSHMMFTASAALLLRRLMELGHGEQLLARPAFQDRAQTDVTVAALADEFRATALRIAALFDARNGSEFQSDQIRTLLAAEPIVEVVPVGAARHAAADVVEDGRSIAELTELSEQLYRGFQLIEYCQVLRVLLERSAEPGSPDATWVDWAKARLASMAGSFADGIEPARSAAAGFAAAGDQVSAQRALLAAAELEVDAGLSSPERAAELASAAGSAIAELRTLTNDAGILAGAIRGYASVLNDTGDQGRAAEFYQEAHDLAVAADEPAWAVQIEIALAVHDAQRGELESALAQVQAANQRMLELGNDAGEAVTALTTAQLLAALERPEEAADLLESHWDALVTLRPSHRPMLLSWRGVWLAQAGRPVDQVIPLLRDSVAGYTAAGAMSDAADTAYTLAGAYLAADRPLEAAEVLEAALPAYLSSGNPIAIGRTRMRLAEALAAIDEDNDALAAAEPAITAFLDAAAWELVAEHAPTAANIAASARKMQTAAQLHAHAVRAFTELGAAVPAARGLRRQARITMLYDLDAGRALFDQARQAIAALTDEHTNPQWELADWHDDYAWALWQRDDNEEAAPYAAEAERGYAAAGDLGGAGRAAMNQARYRTERDDSDGARPHFVRAESWYREAGNDEAVGYIQAQLAGLD